MTGHQHCERWLIRRLTTSNDTFNVKISFGAILLYNMAEITASSRLGLSLVSFNYGRYTLAKIVWTDVRVSSQIVVKALPYSALGRRVGHQ